MYFQSQERPQRKPYVVALRSALSRLASFHSAKLLYPSMVCLYRPSHICKLHSLKLRHIHFVRSPVFNVAVFGYELEYLYESVSLQVQYAGRLPNVNFTDSSVATSVRINLAVTLKLRQPKPSQIANGFEIIKAPVPAIEQYTFGSEATLLGGSEHLSEMIILCRAICRLVIKAIITRYIAVAIGPQKCNEVDTAYDFAVFARPVTAYKLDLFGVLLIESRIIQDQYAIVRLNLMTGFLPEVIAINVNAQKQAVDSIVGRRIIVLWLHPCCFCAAINSWGSNQKIDVIIFIALWSIHIGVLHYFFSTA